MPVAALRLMWSARYSFAHAFQACDHRAKTVSAGGHPTMGGLDLICLGCAARRHQPIGGLYRVVEAMNLRALGGPATTRQRWPRTEKKSRPATRKWVRRGVRL